MSVLWRLLKDRPPFFSVSFLLFVLFVALLILSLTFLAVTNSARDSAALATSGAVFRRIDSRLRLTLYETHVAANTLRTLPSIDNDSFVGFYRIVSELRNTNVNENASVEAISIGGALVPQRVYWAELVRRSELGRHVTKIQSQVDACML
jgi:uncharacterized membrane protein